MWRVVSTVVALMMLAGALAQAMTPDAVLDVLCLLGGVGTCVAVALGVPVPRWGAVILIVVPLEVVGIDLFLTIPSDGIVEIGNVPAPITPLGVGLLVGVAAWATLLLVLRPHDDGTVDEG